MTVTTGDPGTIFVDGGWRPAEGALLDVVDPATEFVIGQVLETGPAGVAAAVAAARRAFDTGGWPELPVPERIRVVQALVAAVAEHAEELAQLQTAQMGLPITWSRALAGNVGRLAAAATEAYQGLELSSLRTDAVGTSLVRREPVGVVAIVIPWNGPLSAIVAKVVPALLTGCTVVLKPAPEASGEARQVAGLASAAGVPDGVFNVVTGGAATGEALVGSPGVDRVSFTGSTASGRRVGEVCGRNLTRVTLELGGKSPAVLLPDADLAAAVPELVMGNFFNSGQICVAVSRVLVHRDRHDELLQALVDRAAAQVVGDPRDEATRLGPLVSARQRDRVEGYVAGAVAEGARVAHGGGRPAGLDRGWFVEPTVLDGVAPGMRVAREEVFGPVLSVLTYADEAEALRLANDSDYGLHGAVFTADPGRGLAFARRITSGSVSLNRSGLTPGTPYGGLKASGIGRDHGREGVEACLETRSYVLPAEYAATLIHEEISFMRKGYVDAPWGQVHYRETGSGPAVLLYPNRPRSSVIYERLAGLLAGRHRVIVIDPPGFGGSDPLPEPFEVPDLTGAVLTLLDALGVDRVRMSGHHTGATICLDLAATHPERVVAIAPTGTLLLTDEERAGRIDGSLFAPAAGNPPQQDGSHLDAFRRKFPPAPPEDLAFLNDVIVDNLVSEPYQAPSAQAVYRYPERERMAGITVPTLFVQSVGPGEPGTLQRAETVLDLIAGSRIAYVDGGDVHFIHHRAEELAAVLAEFFATADAAVTT